jgi:hypothetical protein
MAVNLRRLLDSTLDLSPVDRSRLTPSAAAPTAHSASHKHGGSDEVATATPTANAIPKANGTGVLASGWIPAVTQLTFDSEANIIASTPTSNSIKTSTDTNQETLFVYNAATGYWWELSAYLSRNLSTPDMGFNQDSNRIGYGRDYIAAKTLSQCSIGGNDFPSEGGLRKFYDTTLARNIFQAYLNSAWETILTGFRLQITTDDVRILNFTGYTVSVLKTPGDSVDLGLSGRPGLQSMVTSMGAYQPEPIISGGTF